MTSKTQFKVNDKIRHPRKPEWGLGTIQRVLGDERLEIHFSHQGMKTISTKYIDLKLADNKALPPLYFSISQKLNLKKVITPMAPHLFEQEFYHIYNSDWKNLFLNKNLAKELHENFSHLFSQNDLEFISKGKGRTNRSFYDWLGALLANKHSGYNSLLKAYMLNSDKEKNLILREAMSMEQYINFQEIKSPTKSKFTIRSNEVATNFTINDAPTLFMYDIDKKDSYFVHIRHIDEKITLGQQKFFQLLKDKCGFRIHLINIRPKAKKQDLKQYKVYKDIAKAKVSRRNGI